MWKIIFGKNYEHFDFATVFARSLLRQYLLDFKILHVLKSYDLTAFISDTFDVIRSRYHTENLTRFSMSDHWSDIWSGNCRPLRAEIWSATLEIGAVRTIIYFTAGFISWTDYRRKIENVEDVLVVHPQDFRVSDHWSVARPIPCVAIGLGEGSKCAPIKNCVQNSLIMRTTDRKWNQMSSPDRPSVYRVDWSDSQIGLICQTNRKKGEK